MMLPDLKLPADVAAYVRKKMLLRIASFVILEFICLCVLLLSDPDWLSIVPKSSRPFLYVVFFLIPCAITGIPHKLIDKSWRGRVTAVDIQTRNAFTKEGKPRMHGENVILLTVETDAGKILTREIAAYSFQTVPWHKECDNIKADHYVNEYKIGDHVYHFYGLKHLFIISEGNDQTVPCVVCGQSNNIEEKHCWSCGHSLVKPNN